MLRHFLKQKLLRHVNAVLASPNENLNSGLELKSLAFIHKNQFANLDKETGEMISCDETRDVIFWHCFSFLFQILDLSISQYKALLWYS